MVRFVLELGVRLVAALKVRRVLECRQGNYEILSVYEGAVIAYPVSSLSKYGLHIRRFKKMKEQEERNDSVVCLSCYAQTEEEEREGETEAES